MLSIKQIEYGYLYEARVKLKDDPVLNAKRQLQNEKKVCQEVNYHTASTWFPISSALRTASVRFDFNLSN